MSNSKDKYISILIEVYHSFNLGNVSFKAKAVLAILAILVSVLITFIKILLR